MSMLGKRILVTRGEGQAEEFAALIRMRGGIPVLFPTVRLVLPDDPGPLDEALARPSSFDWILFASPNAAKVFLYLAADESVTGDRPRLLRRTSSFLPPGQEANSRHDPEKF